MMRARFIGNGKDDPASVTLGGVTFVLHGDAMDVPAEWERRVAGNGHFEIEGPAEPVKRKPGRPRRGEDRA